MIGALAISAVLSLAQPGEAPAFVWAPEAPAAESSLFALDISQLNQRGEPAARDAFSQTAAQGPDGGRLTLSYYENPANLSPLDALRATTPDRDPVSGGRSVLRLDYERPLIAGHSGEYDFTISPRAGFVRGPEIATASAGAIARIGQNLRQERDSEPSWYIFAGADAEALTMDFRDGVSLSESLRLQDQIIVGDAQAGVAWRVAGADIALAYMRQERRYESASFGISRTDDYAALSFSLRR